MFRNLFIIIKFIWNSYRNYKKPKLTDEEYPPIRVVLIDEKVLLIDISNEQARFGYAFQTYYLNIPSKIHVMSYLFNNSKTSSDEMIDLHAGKQFTEEQLSSYARAHRYDKWKRLNIFDTNIW